MSNESGKLRACDMIGQGRSRINYHVVITGTISQSYLANSGFDGADRGSAEESCAGCNDEMELHNIGLDMANFAE